VKAVKNIESPRHYQRTVQEIMSTPVATVQDTDTFKHIVEMLESHGISAVPVVSAGGALLGIVSEADLMLKEEGEVPAEILHPIQHHRRQAKVDVVFAGELMTSPAITVTPDIPVAQAARTMQKAGVKRLVVVDGKGRPIGIVSRADVLKIFLRKDAEIRDEVIEGVIKRDMMIDRPEIEVRVDDGVVTLTGEVERASEIGHLERLVFAVDGVVDVRLSLPFRWNDIAVASMAGPLGP
jgi:CBS domain-containing protein